MIISYSRYVYILLFGSLSVLKVQGVFSGYSLKSKHYGICIGVSCCLI